jgi:CO dehydrogenase maturation factor
VANKVRDEDDRRAIDEFCRARGISLVGVVPHDEAILQADRQGLALLDRSPGAASVQAIGSIADYLFA